MTQSGQRILAVVLAAGRGTRLHSAVPKVLHAAAGRPLLDWVLGAARSAGCEDIVAIIGHEADAVRKAFDGEKIIWVLQQEQKGTGHALAQAEPAIEQPGIMLVLSGDVPLVSADTLGQLVEEAQQGWAAMAVAQLADPGSLGRVLTAADGTLQRIVEASDASSEELAIGRVNAGLYALPAPDIFEYLRFLEPDNAKGELYLTDALNAAALQGRPIRLLELADSAESWGVNNRADLGRVHRRLLRRHAERLMESGVTILDVETTTIEGKVTVGTDTVIHPGVSLLGVTAIGRRCTLEQGAWLRDTTVDDGTRIAPYSVLEEAQIAKECQIGPFARMRPGTVVARGAEVGNFVEIKNSELGEGVKANHLAYIGDATVGMGSNIGAGAVTCNYDGRKKSATRIGRNVFVGSDTMLLAPVDIGDEAMTAAGSVVSKDVPDGALAIERSTQRNIAGWARRFLQRKRK